MTTTTLPVSARLQVAKARLEIGWCPHWLGRKGEDRDWRVDHCKPDDPSARQWCARGALMAVDGELDRAAESYLCLALAEIWSEPFKNVPALMPDVILWNNMTGRTQDEVVALYARAFEMALADEAKNDGKDQA